MNILHLNDKLEISGGVEVYIDNVIQYLDSEGCNNIWIGVYDLGFNFTCKIKNGGRSDNLNLNEVLVIIKDIVKNENIDLIHVHSISNSELLRNCFKIAPVVRSMHDPRMFCPGQGKFWRKSEQHCNISFGLHCVYHAYSEGCMNRHPKRVIKALQNTSSEIIFAQENYEAIIVMSKYMLEESVKVGIPREKLFLNPYLTKVVESGNLCFPHSNELKRILFVGRLSKTKGVHYFIKTGIELLKHREDVVFDIVGDGQDQKIFQEMIPNNLKEKFQFLGWKTSEEIERILADSYLLIFSSIYPEAFGISGIEAMMQGKPVVGFDVGGVSTWLKNNQSGFLVPAKDYKQMAEKVVNLLADEKLYSRMCSEARNIALLEFSPKIHIGKLKKIYSDSLNK